MDGYAQFYLYIMIGVIKRAAMKSTLIGSQRLDSDLSSKVTSSLAATSSPVVASPWPSLAGAYVLVIGSSVAPTPSPRHRLLHPCPRPCRCTPARAATPFCDPAHVVAVPSRGRGHSEEEWLQCVERGNGGGLRQCRRG